MLFLIFLKLSLINPKPVFVGLSGCTLNPKLTKLETLNPKPPKPSEPMLPPGSEGRDEDAEGIFVCCFVNRFVCV